MLSRYIMIYWLLMSFSAVCFASSQSHDYQVFRYINPDGRVIFSSKPKGKSYIRLHKTPRGWLPETELTQKPRIKKLPKDYSAPIRQAANRYRLPYYLIHAMITVESAYDPRAVSPAGAQGLMQLMPATAERFGVQNAFDSYENIHGGSRYMAYLLNLFKGNLRLSLAAYNAGENAVIRHGYRIPPYRETQHYVDKVLKTYRKYRFYTPPY